MPWWDRQSEQHSRESMAGQLRSQSERDQRLAALQEQAAQRARAFNALENAKQAATLTAAQRANLEQNKSQQDAQLKAQLAHYSNIESEAKRQADYAGQRMGLEQLQAVGALGHYMPQVFAENPELQDSLSNQLQLLFRQNRPGQAVTPSAGAGETQGIPPGTPGAPAMQVGMGVSPLPMNRGERSLAGTLTNIVGQRQREAFGETAPASVADQIARQRSVGTSFADELFAGNRTPTIREMQIAQRYAQLQGGPPAVESMWERISNLREQGRKRLAQARRVKEMRPGKEDPIGKILYTIFQERRLPLPTGAGPGLPEGAGGIGAF